MRIFLCWALLAAFPAFAADDFHERAETVRGLLSAIEGVTVTVKGNVVIVDGQLTKPDTIFQDYDRILSTQDAFKDIVASFVTISPKLYERAAKQMQEQIDEVPGAHVKVSWLNGTYILIGHACSAAARDRVEAYAQTFVPPMMASQAVKENVLALGAKKYSIRNLVEVDTGRSPASVCPKN